MIIHCTAGKDRTGVICALILSICGVSDETVAYEYSLTEEGLAELKDTLIAQLLGNPALENNEKGAINMISAR
jgi:protein tyrosine/serine phosphatase